MTRARHRGGHGIHSPFLYRLITSVIEDKQKLPDYMVLNGLKKIALKLLRNSAEPIIQELFKKFNLPVTKPHKLYRKVEMPEKYTEVIFRLIRELKPNAVIHYGDTLGINLSAAAMAQNQKGVYQVSNNPEYRLFCDKLPDKSMASNIQWINGKTESSVKAGFLIINCPEQPKLTESIIQKSLGRDGDNGVLIVRGIHETAEAEAIWLKLIASNSVRVSLDLFEIGIALFCKRLQKENFIYRI